MSVFFRGEHTETAGNEIVEIIPAVSGRIPVVKKLVYKAGTQDHNLYVMRVVGTTTTTSHTVSGSNTFNINDTSPGSNTAGAEEALASGDWIAWKNERNEWEAADITSITSAAIDFTGSCAADVPLGTTIWCFYEKTRPTHIAIDLPANNTTTIENVEIPAGIPPSMGLETSRSGSGEPLLVVIDNLTNAGTLQYIYANHTGSSHSIL